MISGPTVAMHMQHQRSVLKAIMGHTVTPTPATLADPNHGTDTGQCTGTTNMGVRQRLAQRLTK